MMTKPISPRMHGIADYALGSMLIGLPILLGLKGKKAAISQCAGASVLLVNALTDHSVALKRVIPVRTHGILDVVTVIGKLGLGLAVGVLKDRKAAAYYLATLAVEATNVLLTDWQAEVPVAA